MFVPFLIVYPVLFILYSILTECIIHFDDGLCLNASRFNYVLLFITLIVQKQTYPQWHIDDFVEFIDRLIE